MDSTKFEKIEYLFYRYSDGSITKEEMDVLNSLILESERIQDKYFDFLKTELAISCCMENNLLIGANTSQTDEGCDLSADSNVSLKGVDTQDVLSDRKGSDCGCYCDPADRAVIEAMHQLADNEETAAAVEIPKEEPHRELIQKVEHIKIDRHISKTSQIMGLLSAAAILFLIIMVRFLPSNASKPVASFVRGLNSSWSNSEGAMEDGVRLWNDGQRYILDQGMAEIVFDSGAKVLIEAPSEFGVINENEMDFEGTLTAEVPDSGHGFTVNTNNSKVVDLGTEFGIKSSAENGTEVHIKKGKVEIAETVSGRKNLIFKWIESGQGYRVSSSGKLSSVSFKKNKFRWDTVNPYEQAVLKTKPLYYWRFDWDRDGLLRNEIDSGLNDEYKLFGLLDYSDGPDLGGGKNAALRLTGRREDYAILRDCTNEADDADDFTIAMWVRPEKTYSAFKKNLILRTKPTNGKGTGRRRSLGFDDENRFYFNSNSKDDTAGDGQAEDYYAISIRSNPVAINAWHHVVVTYIRSDQVSLYVDGKLAGSEELQAGKKLISIIDSNTQWCIGSAPVDKATATSFAGSIDEISQYNRGLTAREVYRIYNAAGGN